MFTAATLLKCKLNSVITAVGIKLDEVSCKLSVPKRLNCSGWRTCSSHISNFGILTRIHPLMKSDVLPVSICSWGKSTQIMRLISWINPIREVTITQALKKNTYVSRGQIYLYNSAGKFKIILFSSNFTPTSLLKNRNQEILRKAKWSKIVFFSIIIRRVV